MDGKVYRKSTKQTGKREAISFAKSYYDNIITQGTVLDPQSSVTNFRVLGESASVTEQAKLQRGELTKMTYDNFFIVIKDSSCHILGWFQVRSATRFKDW